MPVRRVLAALLLAVVLLAVPVARAADVDPTTGPATAPTAGPLAEPPAHLRLEAVTGIANVQPRVQSTVREHPLARWTATYDAATRQWTARLRDPKSTQDLAVVTINDRTGRVVKVDLQEELHPKARLSEKEARAFAERSDKANDWVQRYRDDGQNVTSSLKYDNEIWTLSYFAAGREIARVRVWDKGGKVLSSWTGPQVAWSMARGRKWSFGKRINDPKIFIPLLAVFVVGLFDWRRPLSVRNLDVLMLASFAGSLYFFNAGLIFWSVPLAYPPLVYLLGRLLWLGSGRGARPGYATRWPIWLVAGLAVFALGFRAGLNVWGSNVIDVGYASVVGADRLIDGRSPYGNMPQGTGKPCGTKYSDGSYAAYVQTNGACESAVGRGDTYGPVTYYSYVPMTAALGWSGRWDDLPAAHGTSIVFDLLAAAGLALAGFKLGGRRLAVAALFLWATFPFTVYSMSSNTNDAIPAAFLAWGLALFSMPRLRGFLLGAATAAKFSPILLVPLWVRADRQPRTEPIEWAYTERGPELVPRPSRLGRLVDRLRPGPTGWKVAFGFVLALVLSFVPLMLIDGPWDGLRNFWDRTFGWQLDRPSPFSVWDWGEYPGFPDLSAPQKALKAGLVLLAAGLFLIPRRLDLYRVACYSGALIVGFQICLTHWHYLYIPWFMPFVALALLAPRISTQEALEAVEEVAEPAAGERSRRLAWGRRLRGLRPQPVPTPPRAPAG